MAKQKQGGRPKKNFGKGQIPTVRALAEALTRAGVEMSHQTADRMVKKRWWIEAGFPSVAPWAMKDLPRMVKVIRENRQEDRSKAPEDAIEDGEVLDPDADPWDIDAHVRGGKLATATQVARIALAIEKKASSALNRLITEGKYVSREKAETEAAAKLRALQAAFMQFPKASRQTLADTTDPGKVEDILTTSFRKIFNSIAGGK